MAGGAPQAGVPPCAAMSHSPDSVGHTRERKNELAAAKLVRRESPSFANRTKQSDHERMRMVRHPLPQCRISEGDDRHQSGRSHHWCQIGWVNARRRRPDGPEIASNVPNVLPFRDERSLSSRVSRRRRQQGDRQERKGEMPPAMSEVRHRIRQGKALRRSATGGLQIAAVPASPLRIMGHHLPFVTKFRGVVPSGLVASDARPYVGVIRVLRDSSRQRRTREIDHPRPAGRHVSRERRA